MTEGGAGTSPRGAGITITDTNGLPLPQADVRPTVSGLGTSTLTLTFTGAYGGGPLPAGTYQLNFTIGGGATTYHVEFQVR